MARQRRDTVLIPGHGPLARVSPPVALLLVLGLFVLGAFVGGVLGGIVLLALAAGLGMLLKAAWPALTPPARALRVGVLLILVIVAVVGMS